MEGALCQNSHIYTTIYISNCFTRSKHVTAAAQKADQVLCQLLCVITYRDKHTFIKLFKMYVRSQLEYCGPAWSPWLQKDKDLLEKVQQRAVIAVSGLTGSHNFYSSSCLLSLTEGVEVTCYKCIRLK